jgi:hypothetical protein
MNALTPALDRVLLENGGSTPVQSFGGPFSNPPRSFALLPPDRQADTLTSNSLFDAANLRECDAAHFLLP